MIDPLRIYGYLVLTRAKILDKAATLTSEQYAQEFPIGLGSLDKILTHVLGSEWYYIQRLTRREVPPYEAWEIRHENPLPLPTLRDAWAKREAETRKAMSQVRDWTEPLEYRVTSDDGRKLLVTASPADLATQLILHEVHHRAQAMNLLKRLGADVGELDFNWTMYQRRPAD